MPSETGPGPVGQTIVCAPGAVVSFARRKGRREEKGEQDSISHWNRVRNACPPSLGIVRALWAAAPGVAIRLE